MKKNTEQIIELQEKIKNLDKEQKKALKETCLIANVLLKISEAKDNKSKIHKTLESKMRRVDRAEMFRS